MEEIEQQRDEVRLEDFLDEIKQQQQSLMSIVTQQLADQAWQPAADTVRKLRFFSRLAEQAEALEEKWHDF